MIEPSEAQREPRSAGAAAHREWAGFEAIVDRYEPSLLRYAAGMLGRQTDEAQDIVQEVFLRLHRQRRRHGAASVQDLSVWLFRVAHNLVMDEGRRRSRRERVRRRLMKEAANGPADAAAGRRGAEGGDALDGLAKREAMRRAMAELEGLPESQRQVILLRVVEGMTMRQIGQVVGTTPSNVCYRLQRGLEKLGERLRRAGVI